MLLPWLKLNISFMTSDWVINDVKQGAFDN